MLLHRIADFFLPKVHWQRNLLGELSFSIKCPERSLNCYRISLNFSSLNLPDTGVGFFIKICSLLVFIQQRRLPILYLLSSLMPLHRIFWPEVHWQRNLLGELSFFSSVLSTH